MKEIMWRVNIFHDLPDKEIPWPLESFFSPMLGDFVFLLLDGTHLPSYYRTWSHRQSQRNQWNELTTERITISPSLVNSYKTKHRTSNEDGQDDITDNDAYEPAQADLVTGTAFCERRTDMFDRSTKQDIPLTLTPSSGFMRATLLSMWRSWKT